MLSSGADRVRDAAAHGVPFIPSAVVPRDDWRPPTESERELLILSDRCGGQPDTGPRGLDSSHA